MTALPLEGEIKPLVKREPVMKGQLDTRDAIWEQENKFGVKTLDYYTDSTSSQHLELWLAIVIIIICHFFIVSKL